MDNTMKSSEYSAEIKTEILEIIEAFNIGSYKRMLSFKQYGKYIQTRFETTHGFYSHYYRIK